MPPKKIIDPKLSLYKSSGESYDALHGAGAAKLSIVSSQSEIGVPKFAACAGRRSFKQSNWVELEREEAAGATAKKTSLSIEPERLSKSNFQMPTTSGQKHCVKCEELEEDKRWEEKQNITATRIQQPRMNCHRKPIDFARSIDGRPPRITHYVSTEDEDRNLNLCPKLGHRAPSIVDYDESIMKNENTKMDPKDLENIIDTELKGLKKTWLNRMGLSKSSGHRNEESLTVEPKMNCVKGSLIHSKDINEAWDRIKKQRYQLFQEKFMQSNCKDLQSKNSIFEVKCPVHLCDSSDSAVDIGKGAMAKGTKASEATSCNKEGRCPIRPLIIFPEKERRTKSTVRDEKTKVVKPQRRAASNDDNKRRALSKNRLERKTLLQCRDGFVQVNPTACEATSLQNGQRRARSKVRTAAVKVLPTGVTPAPQTKKSGRRSPMSHERAHGRRQRSSSKNRQRTQSRSRGGCASSCSNEQKVDSDKRESHKPIVRDQDGRRTPLKLNVGYMQVTTTFSDIAGGTSDEKSRTTRCVNQFKVGDEKITIPKGLFCNKPTFNFQKGPRGDGLPVATKTIVNNNLKELNQSKPPLKISAGQRNLANIFDGVKKDNTVPRSKTPTYELGSWKDPLSIFRATRRTPPTGFLDSDTLIHGNLRVDKLEGTAGATNFWSGVPMNTRRGATQIHLPTKHKCSSVTPRPMGTLDMNFGPYSAQKTTTFAIPMSNAGKSIDQPRPSYLCNMPMRCPHYNYVAQEPKPFRNLSSKTESINNVNKQCFAHNSKNVKK